MFRRLAAIGSVSRLAEQRVRAERLRLARELHDGLAQELALIALLASQEESDAAGAIEAAAVRGLDECRQMIETLRGESPPGSDCSLAEALRALAAREGVAIDIRVLGHVELDAQVRFELLRIVTESVRNAVRHGAATRVEVELTEDGGEVVLRVSDNGSGFDLDQVVTGRYGLLGMRERAHGVGGALTVSSSNGGTRVELALVR